MMGSTSPLIVYSPSYHAMVHHRLIQISLNPFYQSAACYGFFLQESALHSTFVLPHPNDIIGMTTNQWFGWVVCGIYTIGV